MFLSKKRRKKVSFSCSFSPCYSPLFLSPPLFLPPSLTMDRQGNPETYDILEHPGPLPLSQQKVFFCFYLFFIFIFIFLFCFFLIASSFYYYCYYYYYYFFFFQLGILLGIIVGLVCCGIFLGIYLPIRLDNDSWMAEDVEEYVNFIDTNRFVLLLFLFYCYYCFIVIVVLFMRVIFLLCVCFSRFFFCS